MSFYQTIHLVTKQDFHGFAVGILRQPLPNGMRFAIVTNTGIHDIKATDVCARFGAGPTGAPAKLHPTATFSMQDGLPSPGELASGLEQSQTG
jgi:hypothetical protein